jgi:hypothetical protein
MADRMDSRRERPAFAEKAGYGLREISGLPSWARHRPSAILGYADSATADRRRLALIQFPFSGVGVGCPIWL